MAISISFKINLIIIAVINSGIFVSLILCDVKSN